LRVDHRFERHLPFPSLNFSLSCRLTSQVSRKQMKGDTIKELLRKCSKVERLDVSLCPINDADVFALSPSNSSLRVLNLEAWYGFFLYSLQHPDTYKTPP